MTLLAKIALVYCVAAGIVASVGYVMLNEFIYLSIAGTKFILAGIVYSEWIKKK